MVSRFKIVAARHGELPDVPFGEYNAGGICFKVFDASTLPDASQYQALVYRRLILAVGIGFFRKAVVPHLIVMIRSVQQVNNELKGVYQGLCGQVLIATGICGATE